MKKILTGTLSLILFVGAVQAQKQDTARHFKGGQDRISKELNLTADQKQKLQSLKQNEKKEMKTLRDKYQNQRQAIFTPDQKQKLETLKSERKANMKNQMRHRKALVKKHHGMKKNAELQKQLNLTQAQKDQMAKLRTDAKNQIQSLRNDQSLTKEQKQEKMKVLMKEQHEKMKSVLTKEQIEKMESAKKERKAKFTK